MMNKEEIVSRDLEKGDGLSLDKGMKLGEPFKTNITNDKEFMEECKNIIKPALLRDVKEMVRGRTLWRRVSVVSETFGKVSSAAATVLAFAAASDLAGGDASRVIGFVSGSVGTMSMVMLLFANFSRAQSIERSDAINLILSNADIDPIPDIAKELVINGEPFGSTYKDPDV